MLRKFLAYWTDNQRDLEAMWQWRASRRAGLEAIEVDLASLARQLRGLTQHASGVLDRVKDEILGDDGPPRGV